MTTSILIIDDVRPADHMRIDGYKFIHISDLINVSEKPVCHETVEYYLEHLGQPADRNSDDSSHDLAATKIDVILLNANLQNGVASRHLSIWH